MKWIGLLLAAATILAGCGGGSSKATQPSSSAITPPGPSGSPSPAPVGRQHFTVVDTAYQTLSNTYGGHEGAQYVEYVTEIHNPNLTYYCAYPQFRITAYGHHGQVLGTDTQVLDDFPPGATLAWAGQIDASAKPQKVKVTYAGERCKPTVTKAADYIPFTTKGVRLNRSISGSEVVGTVHNPYAVKFGELALTALFYRGKRLVGGATDFVDHLPAHSTQPFSVQILADPPRSITRTVVQAQPWNDGSTAKWNNAVYKAEGH